MTAIRTIPVSIDAPGNLAPKPPPRAAGNNTPRAPFRTNLVLDRDHEDALVERAEKWFKALTESSGWDKSSTEEAIEQAVGAAAADLFDLGCVNRQHFIRRAYYAAIAENRWEWRTFAYGPASIFRKQNLSCPLARRISRAMGAKAIKYFFATRPYFCAYPVGPSDEAIAEPIQKVAEHKLDTSKGAAALRDAMNTSFNLGEAVLRVSHRRRVSLYKRNDVVLALGNEPVLAADGNYITQADMWVPVELMDAATGLPRMAEVLKRDGKTEKPQGDLKWLSGSFARTTTHYNGPEISLIDHRNFLANWDAPTLQEAECCVHLYEVSPADMAAMFTNSATGQNILQAMDLIHMLSGVDPVSSPPMDGSGAPASTKIKVREYWLRCDADADGITEDVCLLTAEINGEYVPVFYDYTQNVTETQERPFFPVVPVRKAGSWTGIGAIEMFAQHQEAVDLMLNRWSFAVSSSGHITIFDPSAFVETEGVNGDLTLNDGGTYRLMPGRRLEDSVKRIYLEDTIGPKWLEIMQSFLQMAMNESGVQHANDGAMAGMDTTKLATGIKNVEAAGDENFGVFLASLEDGLQPVLSAFVNTLYARIESDEVYRLTEDGRTRQWTVTPRDVAGLQFDVRILLTRHRSEQMLQSVRAVLPDVLTFYQQPPEVQSRTAPLLIQLLKAAQIENPDEIIAPILPPALPMPGESLPPEPQPAAA